MTKNSKVNCKIFSNMELSNERNSSKVSLQVVPMKGTESINSGSRNIPFIRKCSSMIKKHNRKQRDVEKSTGPENNGYSQIKIRTRNHIDAEDLSKQITCVDKSTFVVIEQKEPVTEPLTRVRKDPALDSQDELFLPEEIVPDRRVQGTEATEALNYEPVEDEKLLEKDKKISSHQATQKEFYDTLKARVAELRRETRMLNQQLRRQATMCEQLSEDNKLLMNELKKTCEPWAIGILEANNPETNPQTD